MTRAGPPGRRSGPPAGQPESRINVESPPSHTDTGSLAQAGDGPPRRARALHPLRRRHVAASRLPVLESGVADPLVSEHRDWQDQHDLRMARAGLAASWQLERARRLWSEGRR